MSRHVVFGTGQVGRPLVEQSRRSRATTSSRSTAADATSFPGAQVVGGDASDPTFTTRVCDGADVVYFCLNARNYARWAAEFPPLQRGVLTGAAARRRPARRARQPLRLRPSERSPARRDNVRQPDLDQGGDPGGDDRGAAERPRRGTGRTSPSAAPATTSGQAPGCPRSARRCSRPRSPVRGRRSWEIPTSRTATPTPPMSPPALVTLGTAAGAIGKVWHLPVAPARTTREIIEHVYALPAIGRAPWRPDGPRCVPSAS